MKRNWNRQFAERGLLGLLERAGAFYAVLGPDKLRDTRGNLLFDGMKHVFLSMRYKLLTPHTI
jgi:hypothetical protein